MHSTPAANGDLCKLCGKVIRAKMISRHLRDQHFPGDTRYECPTCGTVCQSRQSMRHHVSWWHPEWKGVALDTFKRTLQDLDNEATEERQ